MKMKDKFKLGQKVTLVPSVTTRGKGDIFTVIGRRPGGKLLNGETITLYKLKLALDGPTYEFDSRNLKG